MAILNQTQSKNSGLIAPRSYSDITLYLDAKWAKSAQENSLLRVKQLDQALGNPATHQNNILISGINGKSLTLNFAMKLFATEGYKTGILYNPHIISYCERIAINDVNITEDQFAEIANFVITTAESENIKATTEELLMMIAACYFKQVGVTVTLLEVPESTENSPYKIFQPKILGITRMTSYTEKGPLVIDQTTIQNYLGCMVDKTQVISADQSKINLQIMQNAVEAINGKWTMPIRKLAPLPYPFEQLHGRCAALAERICFTYINDILNEIPVGPLNGLLTKRKGMRGRPTLEAKRQSELYPHISVAEFWQKIACTLPYRFQLIEDQKPFVLLDIAENIDAFNNLFLGIRLLHYHRNLKGFAIILACQEELVELPEFLRIIRHFFKKTSGHLIICPTEQIPGQKQGASWNIDTMVHEIKNMKIKVSGCPDFGTALKMAQTSVNDRDGLIVISGSAGLISQYQKIRSNK